MNELESIYKRAIVGTYYNHKDWDMASNISFAIKDYINDVNIKEYALDNYCNFFSSESKMFGIELREPLKDYSINNNIDIVLSFLDIIYKFCNKELSKDENNILTNYKNTYERITWNKLSLNEQKNKIYNNKLTLMCLLPQLESVLKLYIKNIDIKEIYNFNSIENIELTKTGAKFLSNNDDLKIKNSYAGELLDGKITLASDRGEKTRQEDSVLSVVKSDNCFLNVVADGAGGSINADKASKEITTRLKDWFLRMDINTLESLDDNTLKNIINTLIIDINNSIEDKYRGRSYSTVVLALTINNRTLIANVGDSTAYAYNEKRDRLIELTHLDSLSYGLNYERARHNPENNLITRAIGNDYIEPNEDFVHFNMIDENSNIDRIILSSDGVTDLINEKRFKKYFINKTEADDIVRDAVFTPNVTEFKTSDNVSAIVVDLPVVKKNGLRRYF